MKKYQVREQRTNKEKTYYVEEQHPFTHIWHDCVGHAFASLEAAIAVKNELQRRAEQNERKGAKQ